VEAWCCRSIRHLHKLRTARGCPLSGCNGHCRYPRTSIRKRIPPEKTAWWDKEAIYKLAEANQTIYSTHSPFLVGPDELDLVRVMEMKDRAVATKIHTTVAADDPAVLLPLQEALGYDLAQSRFMQQRNLVTEGLTDLWYIEATAELLRAAGQADLDEKIALLSANKASKVVYFATILHANNLKVAALLDFDAAGDQAAKQDTLVRVLGSKRILRTKGGYSGAVAKPEIEDLPRETLVRVAKADLCWEIEAKAAAGPTRPIIDIFEAEIASFSKYKRAKAYCRLDPRPHSVRPDVRRASSMASAHRQNQCRVEIAWLPPLQLRNLEASQGMERLATRAFYRLPNLRV